MEKRALRNDSPGRVRLIVVNFIRVLLFVALLVGVFSQRNLVTVVSALAIFVTFLPSFLERVFNIELPAKLEVIMILFIFGLPHPN